MKVLGISLSTIALVLIVAVVARMYGGKIPLLKGVAAG